MDPSHACLLGISVLSTGCFSSRLSSGRPPRRVPRPRLCRLPASRPAGSAHGRQDAERSAATILRRCREEDEQHRPAGRNTAAVWDETSGTSGDQARPAERWRGSRSRQRRQQQGRRQLDGRLLLTQGPRLWRNNVISDDSRGGQDRRGYS